MRKPVALAAVLLLATACGSCAQAAHRPVPRHSVAAVPPPPSRSCHATSRDPAKARPDHKCTPGATNLAVTPANIHSTICRSGYIRRIRQPADYAEALKRQQIREYGYADPNPRRYEEDSLIPLSLGGAPSDPLNLWPEPGASPNPKDKVELKLSHAVCDGRIGLRQAQRAIVKDWTTAVDIIR
jgi:hypothetical protein